MLFLVPLTICFINWTKGNTKHFVCKYFSIYVYQIRSLKIYNHKSFSIPNSLLIPLYLSMPTPWSNFPFISKILFYEQYFWSRKNTISCIVLDLYVSWATIRIYATSPHFMLSICQINQITCSVECPTLRIWQIVSMLCFYMFLYLPFVFKTRGLFKFRCNGKNTP